MLGHRTSILKSADYSAHFIIQLDSGETLRDVMLIFEICFPIGNGYTEKMGGAMGVLLTPCSKY